MSRGAKIGLIIGGVILLGLLILVMTGVSNYNKFVELNQSVNKEWSMVENQYQRRLDLIPNLVNTVKGAANFEQKTLVDVTEARAKATSLTITPEVLNNPQAFAKFQQIQGEVSSALSRLLVSVEKYPDLKANESFLQLQSQLEGTENRINVARNKFNESVNMYNTSIKRFPAVIFAGIFGFGEKQYFQSAAGADKAPAVQF